MNERGLLHVEPGVTAAQQFLPPNRTIKFRSELSLAAFIKELPGRMAFEVVEQERRGDYLLTFL